MNDISIIDMAIKLASSFGLPGVVLLIWYLSDRDNKATLKQYREDMVEMRKMYTDNVELVKGYRNLAEGLQSLIVLVTQTITRLCEEVRGNQFCPMVRLKKQATGREE